MINQITNTNLAIGSYQITEGIPLSGLAGTVGNTPLLPIRSITKHFPRMSRCWQRLNGSIQVDPLKIDRQ